MEKEYINSAELLHKAQILYEFNDLFSNYESTARSYTEGGEPFNMIDVHTLDAIERNPGLTSAELCEKMRRSKSFVSQILNKMENKGYLIRVEDELDAKKKHLFVTQAGKELCQQHNDFDERTLLKTYNYLLRDCTPEEIDNFYKVMSVYNNIMNAAARKRKGLKKK